MQKVCHRHFFWNITIIFGVFIMKALIRRAKEAPAPVAVIHEQPQSEEDIPLPSESEGTPLPRRIGEVATVRLLDSWLSEEAAGVILRNLQRRQKDFVTLRTKRTARFGGDVGPPFVPETLPGWLDDLCGAVSKVGNLTPKANHVLVNHYEPGQGILPHTDGPAYSPWAAILSLGSAAVFDFWRDHAHAAKGMLPALSLLLPPGSLLIFSEDAYQKHLHGLADRPCDTLEGIANASLLDGSQPEGGGSTWRKQLQADGSLRREHRYSLTIRHVPHTESLPRATVNGGYGAPAVKDAAVGETTSWKVWKTFRLELEGVGWFYSLFKWNWQTSNPRIWIPGPWNTLTIHSLLVSWIGPTFWISKMTRLKHIYIYIYT